MARDDPIPENPLIGSEDLAAANDSATRATQKQAVTCSEASEPSTATETTETMAVEDILADSTVLVIPAEDQETIKSFWVATEGMEDDKRADSAVDITLPEPQEEVRGRTAEDIMSAVEAAVMATAAVAEEASPEASPETPAETTAPAAETPAAEPQTEAEAQATETPAAETPAAETTATETPVTETPATETPATETPAAPAANAEEQVATPPAPPAPPVHRNEVPFRKSCATCSNHEWRTRCWAGSCYACGDPFVKMFEDEIDNEELRAKVVEAERPACNPGEEETAYCKSCLIDWFDNCIAWPHREPLPKTENHPMLPILKPFVSEGYVHMLNQIQKYWDDKEKLFCPVPSCSTYIPRENYMVTREVEVKVPVVKPVEEKKEEKTEETTTTEAQTEGQNTETPAAPNTEANAEAVTEPAAPVAEPEETPTANEIAAPTVIETTTAETAIETATETAAETTAETAAETAVETAAETTTEAVAQATNETAEVVTETSNEAAPETTVEDKKEEEAAPEPEFETIMVEKELKSQLTICPSASCRTPICTLCKSHFHGLDTPCPSRTSFYKEFMLAKYANPEPKKEEGEEGGENNDSNDDEDEYDEDGEYEEYPNRFRQCVNCQNLVARHTGCDHMTCACGFAFCFYCGGAYGQYHSCISPDEYKEGTGVGGIKITNEDGFLDEGAEVVVNVMGLLPKEEEVTKVEKFLEVVEFMEEEKTKKSWKVKAEITVETERQDVEKLLTTEEAERLAKPMKNWKGKYY